jgi:lysophospholipase L1-like esterase
MKKILLSSIAISGLLALQSCKNEFDEDLKPAAYTAGQANFSKYVALGNSLTAGYRDGALFSSGQKESYASILAEQMKNMGGGNFEIPFASDDMGGLIADDNKTIIRYTRYIFNNELKPRIDSTIKPTTTLANIYKAGGYQNMGVPGAKSFHLLYPGFGNKAGVAVNTANPFFARFSSSPNATVLQDAVSQSPSFFSLWIGNNDTLLYAIEGGAKENITPVATFTAAYTAIVEGMLNAPSKPKGVLANLPMVVNIPYFTTIPYNAIPLSKSQADGLNPLFGLMKQALSLDNRQARFNLLKEGQNPVLIFDKDLFNTATLIETQLAKAGYPAATAKALGLQFGQTRHATPEDFICLTAGAELKKPSTNPMATPGVTLGLADALVLSRNEATLVNNATKAYNVVIENLANKYQLAFVDANAAMGRLNTQSGILYNGVKYTTAFAAGGAFSADGVHPTGRGYAILANEFAKAINARYQSNIPMVNPNNYKGNYFK